MDYLYFRVRIELYPGVRMDNLYFGIRIDNLYYMENFDKLEN